MGTFEKWWGGGGGHGPPGLPGSAATEFDDLLFMEHPDPGQS